METYYSTSVEVFENNRWRSLVLAGDKNKDVAIFDAQKSVKYYQTECNYQNLRIELTHSCANCFNDPRGIFKPKGKSKWFGTWKKCPNCRGNFPAKTEIIYPE